MNNSQQPVTFSSKRFLSTDALPEGMSSFCGARSRSERVEWMFAINLSIQILHVFWMRYLASGSSLCVLQGVSEIATHPNSAVVITCEAVIQKNMHISGRQLHIFLII